MCDQAAWRAAPGDTLGSAFVKSRPGSGPYRQPLQGRGLSGLAGELTALLPRLPPRAQEGRFRSPNRPNHQSREQMGLFRSPRSRPGGSGAQEGRFRSRRVIDAVMVGRQSAAGCWQRAVGNGQLAAGSGERAAGSGERTERRNRLRKGSATKALIIQHLNADNCLQIRIILTTIAKNYRRQDRGKVVADQHYFGFPPTRYKLKFNKNVLIL